MIFFSALLRFNTISTLAAMHHIQFLFLSEFIVLYQYLNIKFNGTHGFKKDAPVNNFLFFVQISK